MWLTLFRGEISLPECKTHTFILTYTLCLKNASFYILNNSAKIEPFLIVFTVQNLEEISHQKIINAPTSPG